MGNINKMPKNLTKKLKSTEQLTKKNTKLQINVALNYGSNKKLFMQLKI